MDNKICVYAIAKNESQFVERWMDSMSEADYVCVLDTGSTDNTVELLQARGAIVEQKEIAPWRFDVARNESMKLIPEDANILVCTDLDEFFEPGWADALRANWTDTTLRAWYKYAWSHDESGNPARVFYYDKIHCRGWYWKHPVHEYLYSDLFNDEDVKQNVLNLFDSIYLHHFADPTKSRGSYLPLLELRKKESPDDWIGRMYLSHEYNYRGMYEESIKELEEIVVSGYEGFGTIDLAASFMFMGDNYRALDNKWKAIECYDKAIEMDSTFREPYFLMAECFNELGKYESAIAAVKEGIKKSYRHYSWLERDASWNEQSYDILSISYYYMKDLERSYANVIKAHFLNPLNTRISDNKEFIEKIFLNCL